MLPSLGRGVVAEDTIAQVRERSDIVALVGEYVPLKRSGASFKGVCPFHNEKTPSFYVHPDRQFFHCFGCKASGDTIGFYMRMEGASFMEAITHLAERAGVELPDERERDDGAERRKRQRKERLLAVMDAAAGFFRDQLAGHRYGHMAVEALKERNVPNDVAERFRLGYAPAAWDALSDGLSQRGFSEGEMIAAGLVAPRKSGSGVYDRFRHRLMFPISNRRGQIVAFSGRALPPAEDSPLTSRADSPAKYINSPESELYIKGDMLFGQHEGRVALRQTGVAIICEGNFDVVALHAAGMQNVVAPLGTALTEAHTKALRRFAKETILVFDGDAAGRKAARASYGLLAKQGIRIRIARLPEKADPDSVRRELGDEGLRAVIDEAIPAVDAFIDDAARAAGGDPSAVGAAVESLAPLIASIKNHVERELYISRISERFSLHDVALVRRQLRAGLRGGSRSVTKRTQEREMPAEPQKKRPADLPPVESELFGALLDHPELLMTPLADEFAGLIRSPDIRRMYQAASESYRTHGRLSPEAVLLVADAAAPWLKGRLAITKYDEETAEGALSSGLSRLRKLALERELSDLSRQILAARQAGEHELAVQLTQRRTSLFRSAKELRAQTDRCMNRGSQ